MAERASSAPKLGPCRWGFHAWPKWTDVGEGQLFTHALDHPEIGKVQTGVFTQQERRCVRCGKLQYRREKVS